MLFIQKNDQKCLINHIDCNIRMIKLCLCSKHFKNEFFDFIKNLC